MKQALPEGSTPLDPNEREGLLPTSITTQGELNAFEQANIFEAERWALGRKHLDCLTDSFVRALHRRMLKRVWKWAGSYRTTNKNLGVDWPQVPAEVRKACADGCFWIEHHTYDWDELAARVHHRLVCIHPFPNGNGRHARLMSDVLLKTHGRRPFSWGSAESLVVPGEVRAAYLAALRAADGRDFGPLLRFARS